ncbi:hemin uptake protein HemP [Methylocystis sp. S23]
MKEKTNAPKQQDAARPSETRNASQGLEFDAHELLGSGKEAIIIHAGERYRLRITANNKLILTK